MIHQALVFDALQHLPAPPCHLAGVNLKAVQLLNVFDPLFLLACELAIPIHFVDVALRVNGVILVTPPAAEDSVLGFGRLGGLVHVVEHVKALSCTLEHVEAFSVLLRKRGNQGG